MVKFIIKSILNKTYFYHKKNSENLSYFTKISKNKKLIRKILKEQNTPIFIGEKDILKTKYQALKQTLNHLWGANNEVAYSFKTNYSVISNEFFKKNFTAEIVSEYELSLAQINDYQKIIFNGPAKTLDAIQKSVTYQPIINIDNLEEIKNLSELTEPKKQAITWGIRLKTDEKSRFGLANKEAVRALEILKKNKIKVEGIHIHLGTNIFDTKKYQQAAIKLKEFIKNNNLINQLKFIDFGGGFASHAPQPANELIKATPVINEYIKAIVKPLKNIFTANNQPKLLVEPGRYIVEDAICLISKVTNVTFNGKKQIVTCDATNNILPLVHYRPQLVSAFNSELNSIKTPKIKTLIFGSSCQENDLLFSGYLEKVNSQDLLVFFAVGAYNSSIGGDFIFNKPKLILI